MTSTAIFILILFSNWLGFNYRKRLSERKPEDIPENLGTLEGSLLGLMALILTGAWTLLVFAICAGGFAYIAKAPQHQREQRAGQFGSGLGTFSAIGYGTIWIPDKEQSLVYRVDAAAAKVVDSFAAGPGAFLTLSAFRSMWVTSYAGDDVWRFGA